MAKKINMKEIFYARSKRSPEQVDRDFSLADEALEVLREILEGKIKELKEKDYDKASWPFWRADVDGYNRALKEVISLLT